MKTRPALNRKLDGGFDTRDFAPWHAVHAVPCSAKSGIGIVRKPRLSGLHAARFAVKEGQQPLGACCHGERSEVVLNPQQTGAEEGEEAWYR